MFQIFPTNSHLSKLVAEDSIWMIPIRDAWLAYARPMCQKQKWRRFYAASALPQLTDIARRGDRDQRAIAQMYLGTQTSSAGVSQVASSPRSCDSKALN
jgi:hypothetical protein